MSWHVDVSHGPNVAVEVIPAWEASEKYGYELSNGEGGHVLALVDAGNQQVYIFTGSKRGFFELAQQIEREILF